MTANRSPLAGIAALHDRMAARPGWHDFMSDVAPLASYASTPGWEDNDAKKTVAGAKPIGIAQWGSAILTAAMVTDAVRGAAWPVPGVDPGGFIWLTWRFDNGAELALELHANLLAQTYKWTSLRDGMPAVHTSNSARDVIEALRSVMVGVSS